MKRTKKEIEIDRKLHIYRAKVNFYKEKINDCYKELIEIEKNSVVKNLEKAQNIIKIIKDRYSLDDDYNVKISRKNIDLDPVYKAIKLVDNNTKLSMNILEALFNKDRTTINHVLRAVDNFYETEKKYRLEYQSIMEEHKLKYKKYKPRRTGRKAKIKIEIINQY